jgi:hypothetical protein
LRGDQRSLCNKTCWRQEVLNNWHVTRPLMFGRSKWRRRIVDYVSIVPLETLVMVIAVAEVNLQT